MWEATWTPWGAPHAITGAATLDARFPGQWFQLESGLHYNWHRHYDPTIGRYTQPDPLGFVDGPSVYGYARGSPEQLTDPQGRFVPTLPIIVYYAQAYATPLALAATASAMAAILGGDEREKVWGPDGVEYYDPEDLPSSAKPPQPDASGGNDDAYVRAERRCRRLYREKGDYAGYRDCVRKAVNRHLKKCPL